METKPHRMSYRFNAAASEPELLIYDVIGADAWTGEGVSAKQFAADLKALGDVDEITVRINSVGGSVFDGHAIYNQLAQHPANIEVCIDGCALSAASVIAMAGDEINIALNAVMMIHDAWGITIGGAEDMRKEADVLDKLNGTIANVYAARTGKSVDEIRRLMAEETWLDSEEAVELGFATSIIPAKKIAACIRPAYASSVPEKAQHLFTPNGDPTMPPRTTKGFQSSTTSNMTTAPAPAPAPANDERPEDKLVIAKASDYQRVRAELERIYNTSPDVQKAHPNQYLWVARQISEAAARGQRR